MVHDEGQDYRGIAAIRRWSDGVIEKYHLRSEVLDAVEEEDETIVTALVFGSFDGSPAWIGWVFNLRDGKIAELRTQ